MKRVVFAACIAASIVSGCKKDSKETVTPDVPEVTEKSAAKNPEGCNSDLSAPIAADYTLTAKCSPYTPASEFNVDGYTLTIEPGVEVRVADGQTFNVGYYKPAKLIVKGTKEKPVKFTGGVTFYAQAAGSSLEGVVIENAGTDEHGALRIETHELSLKDVAIVNAKKTAIEARVDKALKAVSGIDLTRAGGDASELVHLNFGTAGVIGAGVTVPEGAVVWLHGNLDAEITLVSNGAPYRVAETATIDPPEGKTASLTLKEGVTVELGESAGLEFGYYRGTAALKVLGTKEKPVVVTRYGDDKASTPSNGLRFFNGARAPEIDWLVLEYAGAADRPALFFNDARGLGKLTNSTFRHIKTSAIAVETSKERFTAFDGNTFEDVEGAALRLPLELAHGLGAKNVFTDKARVTVFGEAKKDTTLTNLGAPYVVEGEVNFNGEATKSATLKLEDGVSVLFNSEGKLAVGYYGPAKLAAKGVSFAPLDGKWKGVALYNSAVVELENSSVTGVNDDSPALELTPEVTGFVKKVVIKGAKVGVKACAPKVKVEGTSPISKCE